MLYRKYDTTGAAGRPGCNGILAKQIPKDMLPIQKSFDGHLADEEPTPGKLLLPRFAEPCPHAEVVVRNNNFKPP
jgi:hypothetical protein